MSLLKPQQHWALILEIFLFGAVPQVQVLGSCLPGIVRMTEAWLHTHEPPNDSNLGHLHGVVAGARCWRFWLAGGNVSGDAKARFTRRYMLLSVGLRSP
jgi:hypothetical protein